MNKSHSAPAGEFFLSGSVSLVSAFVVLLAFLVLAVRVCQSSFWFPLHELSFYLSEPLLRNGLLDLLFLIPSMIAGSAVWYNYSLRYRFERFSAPSLAWIFGYSMTVIPIYVCVALAQFQLNMVLPFNDFAVSNADCTWVDLVLVGYTTIAIYSATFVGYFVQGILLANYLKYPPY
jgi:hypothetical protein